jgi:hypothetical protein
VSHNVHEDGRLDIGKEGHVRGHALSRNRKEHAAVILLLTLASHVTVRAAIAQWDSLMTALGSVRCHQTLSPAELPARQGHPALLRSTHVGTFLRLRLPG